MQEPNAGSIDVVRFYLQLEVVHEIIYDPVGYDNAH